MPRHEFRPILVKADTPHGVVLSRPWGIALDGLLSSVIWHERKFAARAAGLPWERFSPTRAPEELPLPLQRCGDPATDPDWHWMCTFGQTETGTIERPDTRWRTSRTDHTRLQQLSPVISHSRVSDRRGRYQNRVIPVLVHQTLSLTWRAVGDPDRVRELLEELPAIGKYTGTGEGVVARWTVDDADHLTGWSAGHEHAPGILGRATPGRCLEHRDAPADLGEQHPVRVTAVRAPYLHPSTQHEAFLPHH
ncbi:CRISPR-associated protein Cas6 C-terminal domain-containing protein [Tsukamurella hominis]